MQTNETYIYNIYIYIYITNGRCGDETYLKVETIVVCYTKLFLFLLYIYIHIYIYIYTHTHIHIYTYIMYINCICKDMEQVYII